jgi:hypothetical protein
VEIRIIKTHVGLIAAAAIAASTLPTVPSANAAANCTVPGAVLNLHDSSGYDVAVDSSGSSLGPSAVIRTPDTSFDGSVFEGGITGRAIKFNVGNGKAYIHFEGTVGADGIAHGSSSGTAQPVVLLEGTWDSVDPLSCS